MLRTDHEAVLFVVLEAVAAEQNTSVQSLPPLQEWIETDALLRLLDHATRASSNLHVRFDYDGSTVTVDAASHLTA